MFNESDFVEKCRQYVAKVLRQIMRGEFDISYFELTKKLRKHYKGKKKTNRQYACRCGGAARGRCANRACVSNLKQGDHGEFEWDDVTCGLAHVGLCQRMKERDPGMVISPNDRISYVFVVNNNGNPRTMLQADRIEATDVVRSHPGIRIDYEFYISNQIMNPAIQFLELIMDDPEALFEIKNRSNSFQTKLPFLSVANSV
jgi:DNA polymerase elongation subunit (family B)